MLRSFYAVCACLIVSTAWAQTVLSTAWAQTVNPPTQVSGQAQVSGQTSLWRGSKLIGVSVYGGANDKLGEIRDLIMDRQGQVSHVVISVGGVAPERLVPVKLDVLRFPHRIEPGTAPDDTVNNRWYPERAVLATTREALLALPEFKF